MFEELLFAVEKGILEVSGAVPVVFGGLERNFEKSTKQPGLSRHDYHELVYVRSGEVDFVVNGEVIPLHRRSCLIVKPGISHGIRVRSQRADTVVLHFGFSESLNGGSVSEMRERAALPDSLGRPLVHLAPQTLESFLDFANGEREGASPYLVISGRSSSEIGLVMERIVSEWKKDAFAKDMMLQLLIMELLVVISRALREEWEESLRVRLGKARELVLIARDYLVENHDRDVTVADAAAYVFLSQGYFTRAFRDELGISPMGFLMQVRVNHACKLLAQEEIKVSGVALQVGFSSPQRFNVAFRKHMGMTPMQYRQKVLSESSGSSSK